LLSALLSQALVAFTIEFDNEFERRMPHRTTNHGSTSGASHAPWLVSLVMWSNCIRFAREEGVRVSELEDLARTPTNLNGMQRWGYIVVSDSVIRATPAGRMARELWGPLFDVIEKRWEQRFGADAIGRLRESLPRTDAALPDCLPILGYGLFSRGPDRKPKLPAVHEDHLAALLARVLLAFAMEFENESEVSLAICANIVRVLDEKPVPVRDLPRLSGVSKEAINVALGFLGKRGLAVTESAGRTKLARLTPKGREARNEYLRRLATIETRWESRYAKLRAALEPFEGKALFEGIEPHPGNWRASVPKPETLPHFPMVLHRGGFPDGS
jgi:hypothetical protein